MSQPTDRSGLQLRSLIRGDGILEVSLMRIPIASPASNEVLIRVEAAPINPSDLGLLFGAADMRAATASQKDGLPLMTAPVSQAAMKAMAARVDQSMPVGNEAAGVVVEAGSSDAARALMGKTVAALGGAMYAQYRCVPVEQCLVLPDGATPVEGASAFVNPLTALGMVETMRREGHTALVHTAAASNLGQMLNRICLEDGIGLVNIVRKQDQFDLLEGIGATHICNSESPTFLKDLADAIAETGATLAFDAIGGGKLAGQILSCMEVALSRSATEYSRYGSATHKQVYIYGGLDTRPTELVRDFGMTRGMGGWLLFQFLQKIEPAAVQALKRRVADSLTTTFASHYARQVSLAQMLHLDTIAIYNRRATGEKFLVDPSKDV